MSSRLASISSFSANGSPTWTLGRLDGTLPERRAGQHRGTADAVAARAEPNSTARFRARGRGPRQERSSSTPMAITLTSGLPGRRVEHELAANGRHAHAIAIAADAADHAATSDASGPASGHRT